MDASFVSAIVVLLLVLDPVGNIPVFVAVLRRVPPARRPGIVLRECAIALAILVLMALAGRPILDTLGLTDRSLNIAGGVILFLIALRMIFRNPEGIFGEVPEGEPFIVPLATPAVAGPTAIASVMLLVSRAPQRMAEWLLAVTAAMLVVTFVLVFAERIAKTIGERGVVALERLTGLLLTAIAVEMLLRGIEGFVRGLQAA